MVCNEQYVLTYLKYFRERERNFLVKKNKFFYHGDYNCAAWVGINRFMVKSKFGRVSITTIKNKKQIKNL